MILAEVWALFRLVVLSQIPALYGRQHSIKIEINLIFYYILSKNLIFLTNQNVAEDSSLFSLAAKMTHVSQKEKF